MEKITLPLILVLLTGAVKGSEWPQWRDGDSFKWSENCDFYGNDMYYRQGPAEACGKMCEDEVKCTHFTWRTAHNGTCWLKRGNHLAALSLNKTSVCGYMQRGAGDRGSNQEWPQWRDGESFKWSEYCDFSGYDMYYRHGPAEACGKMCEDEVKCTHFTWRSAHNGTCWLKRGYNLAASSLNKYSVCGYMQRGAGDRGSNQEWPQWRDGESFKWSEYCDFSGYDMYYRQGPAEACGKMCEDEVKCTHFTWRSAHNGTCWLKRGYNLAASSLNKYSVCGYMQRGAGDRGCDQGRYP